MRQPIMKNKIFKKNFDSNKISDDVMANGLLIGCHHGLSKKDIQTIFLKFENFIRKMLSGSEGGFEPPTPGLRVLCSNQLSYLAKEDFYNIFI